jgi:hypothetical protein
MSEDRSNFLMSETMIALMMEAASTFEKSANFYQTTRRNNPEDSHIYRITLL